MDIFCQSLYDFQSLPPSRDVLMELLGSAVMVILYRSDSRVESVRCFLPKDFSEQRMRWKTVWEAIQRNLDNCSDKNLPIMDGLRPIMEGSAVKSHRQIFTTISGLWTDKYVMAVGVYLHATQKELKSSSPCCWARVLLAWDPQHSMSALKVAALFFKPLQPPRSKTER